MLLINLSAKLGPGACRLPVICNVEEYVVYSELLNPKTTVMEMYVLTNLTKDLIKKTFISLLERMPLSQISVKLIVEECGINRNSFYYHYHDLPALIEEMVREEADRIMAEYPTSTQGVVAVRVMLPL